MWNERLAAGAGHRRPRVVLGTLQVSLEEIQDISTRLKLGSLTTFPKSFAASMPKLPRKLIQCGSKAITGNSNITVANARHNELVTSLSISVTEHRTKAEHSNIHREEVEGRKIRTTCPL